MAKATVIKSGHALVFIGDNANPIVYKTPCGFTSRSISLSKSLNETRIPDCDDPDAPDWIERDVTSLSMSISGEGVLAENSVSTWVEAFKSSAPLNVKVEWKFPTKKITYTGKMHLESFEVGISNGETVSVNVSMQSSGEMSSVEVPVTP